jgi:hypothetical protein
MWTKFLRKLKGLKAVACGRYFILLALKKRLQIVAEAGVVINDQKAKVHITPLEMAFEHVYTQMDCKIKVFCHKYFDFSPPSDESLRQGFNVRFLPLISEVG